MLRIYFTSAVAVFIFMICLYFTAQAASNEVLKGEAIGKVLLNGEAWGTGKITFTNVSGDASFVVNCEKDISAGANSASCIGTNVNGFFSGGPNGYAVFASGSDLITLQLVDGQKFTYTQGGVTAELIVNDPSIFNHWGEVDEDEVVSEPGEYDPNVPLTDSRARAADIDGQVEIACPPNFDTWDILKSNTIIYNHCRLKTGEDSTLKISFGDMTTFVMKPETEVIINETTREKSNFQLLFGGVWANVKKMIKGEEMQFHGSQAVAGIKGTTFVMEEKDNTSTLKVLEGTVNFTSKANGQSMEVTTGQIATANDQGLSKIKNFDVKTESKYWESIFDKKVSPETNRKMEFNYLYIGLAVFLIIIITVAVLLLLFFTLKKKKV